RDLLCQLRVGAAGEEHQLLLTGRFDAGHWTVSLIATPPPARRGVCGGPAEWLSPRRSPKTPRVPRRSVRLYRTPQAPAVRTRSREVTADQWDSSPPSGASSSAVLAAWAAALPGRFLATQPAILRCCPRATASEPAGTSFVITDPAAV